MALATAGFKLGIRPVASLRPHEEVIPRHVVQLASDMAREGIQRDPVIIDRESGTVLDGMHRTAAFPKLGLGYAVCCAVDYSSPAVTLRRWARVYETSTGDSVRLATDALAGMKRVPPGEAFGALARMEVGSAVLTKDAAFLSGTDPRQEAVAASIGSLDRLAERMGWERRFVPDDEVDAELRDSRNLVVLPRRLDKDDIVNAARSGRLFSCKTSMHAIDPRPVAVNYPIADLARSEPAANPKLEADEGTLLPPGSVYLGRRYKERLLLLDKR